MTKKESIAGDGARTPSRRRNHAAWFGPLVTFTGGVTYFTVSVRFPVLRDFPWLNLPVVAAGVIVSAVAVWRAFGRPDLWRGRVSGALGLVVSLVLAALFGWYVFGLSYGIPGPTAATLALERAPALTLPDHRERPVSLADLRGRKVVLVFYRGFW